MINLYKVVDSIAMICVFPPLNDIMFVKVTVDIIENPFFISGPHGRQQLRSGTVPGETVDYDIRPQVFDTVPKNPGIFF